MKYLIKVSEVFSYLHYYISKLFKVKIRKKKEPYYIDK